jgi:ACS family glucarate transporter-like MFS transporter
MGLRHINLRDRNMFFSSPKMPDRPTRVRWKLLGLLTTIMVVTALGRLNLGVSAANIQDQFGFSTQTMGWILGAFAFGYAFFQVPSGWAGDRFGPRITLTWAVVWWATLTIAFSIVPAVAGHSLLVAAWSFGIIRFLTGAGEAASYPNANKIVANWTADTERGLGSSLLLGGVGAGGVLAPIMLSTVSRTFGWRWSFVLCGLIALCCACAWYLYSTNTPEEHARVNPEELRAIRSTPHLGERHSFRFRGTPWERFLASRSVWALLLSYLCHGYTPYIYFTWFFLYLTRVRGMTVSKSGAWGSTPFIAMTLMALLGGWISDKAILRQGRRRGRQLPVWIGMTASAALLWSGSHQSRLPLSVLMLALAAGFSSFAAPSWWATCIDLSPHHSGSLSGLMNTCANVAGGIAPILTAYLATHFSWTQALNFAALVNLTAAALFCFVNADDNLEERQGDSATEEAAHA